MASVLGFSGSDVITAAISFFTGAITGAGRVRGDPNPIRVTPLPEDVEAVDAWHREFGGPPNVPPQTRGFSLQNLAAPGRVFPRRDLPTPTPGIGTILGGRAPGPVDRPIMESRRYRAEGEPASHIPPGLIPYFERGQLVWPNGPNEFWTAEDVAAAERLGVHPSRLPWSPYSARYLHVPLKSFAPQIDYTTEAGSPIFQNVPAFGSDSNTNNVYSWQLILTTAHPSHPLAGGMTDETVIPPPSELNDYWRGSKKAIPPVGIDVQEWIRTFEPSTAAGSEGLRFGHRPTRAVLSGSTVIDRSNMPYLEAELQEHQAYADQWPMQSFDQRPEGLAQQRSIEIAAFQCPPGWRCEQAPSVHTSFVAYPEIPIGHPGLAPGGREWTAAEYDWFIANRGPGYAPDAPSDYTLSQYGYDPDAIYAAEQAGLAPSPQAVPIATATRAPTPEVINVGWFDSIVDVLPDLLSGIGGIITATNPRSPVPAPSPLAFNDPMFTPAPTFPAGVGGPLPVVQNAAWPALIAPAIRAGGLIAGGATLPGLFGGGSGGGGGVYQDIAGTDTPMFQQNAATGQIRTKSVVEAIDHKGRTRYWVGGVVITPKQVKAQILRNIRRRRHHHHPR